jgi:hypothetical protein
VCEAQRSRNPDWERPQSPSWPNAATARVVPGSHHRFEEHSMTAIVSSTSPGSAAALADDAAHDAHAPDASAPSDATHDGAEHPLAKFALNDLHQAVQRFAAFAPDAGHGADTLFAPQGTPADSKPGAGIPLYGGKQPGAVQGQQLPATPVKPGPPIDLQQMVTLNKIAQGFRVNGSPMDHGRLKYTQQVFQAATDALKKGDYPEAEKQFAKLGLPFPPPGDNSDLTEQQQATAHVLGVGATATGRGWRLDPVQLGAHGHQPLNDLSGYAANTKMINRMASMPGGVSNPPTEAQATGYMRELTQVAKGKPAPTAQQVMQAASDITRGTIMHYSAAGLRKDPVYDLNPNPRAFYLGRDGQRHEFASGAEAQKAADAGKPPKEPGASVTLIQSRSPDQWSDITSQGQRAGRYIGDCESKVYLQTRLLTEAGFTSLGSVDVQHKDHSGPGHMFGVFKAPDGTIWVTSNEEFKQVRPSYGRDHVTQADIDATVREFTGEVYHIEPNYKGEIDVSAFTFSAAATAKLSGPNAAIDSIRRSTELGVLGRNEILCPERR